MTGLTPDTFHDITVYSCSEQSGHFSTSIFDSEANFLASFAGGVSPGTLSRFDIADEDTKMTPQQNTKRIVDWLLAFAGTVLPI